MTSFGLDCMGKQLLCVWMKFLFFLQLQLECLALAHRTMTEPTTGA